MGTERREDQVGVGVVEGGQHGGTGQVMDLRVRAHQVVEAVGAGGHGGDAVAAHGHCPLHRLTRHQGVHRPGADQQVGSMISHRLLPHLEGAGSRTSRSKKLIEGRLSAAHWLAESNGEVRRAVAERMGYEWLLDSASAKKIATDEYGTLWRIITGVYEEDIVLVDLVNSTPEPDGSFKRYVLRVPPDQTVPRDAIGWSFGLPPGAYGPATMT